MFTMMRFTGMLLIVRVVSIGGTGDEILAEATARNTLDTITASMESNFQQIERLKGTATIREQIVIDMKGMPQIKSSLFQAEVEDDVFSREQVIKVDFVADIKSKKLYNKVVSQKPVFTGLNSGLRFPTPRAVGPQATFVITPGRCMVAKPLDYSVDGEVLSHICRIQEGVEPRQAEDVAARFDPQELFSLDGQRPFWEQVRHCLGVKEAWISQNQPQAPPTPEWRLERRSMDGRTVHHFVFSGQGGNKTVTQEYAFDEAVGGNVVFVTERYGEQIVYEKTFEYREIEDLFLPSKLTRKSYDFAGNLILKREVTMDRLELNPNLQPEVFELAALGLKNGEPVIDLTQAKQFKYADGGLSPSASSEFLPQTQPAVATP